MRLTRLLATIVVACAVGGCASDVPPLDTAAAAPDSSRIVFETSRGRFVVEVRRAWAPLGADRFHELVSIGYFDDGRFFRVLPGFVAQFGVHADPALNKEWDTRTIRDEPLKTSNTRGTLAFAREGPDNRTHQIFISTGENSRLDTLGFVPFARVVEGMDVVDSIYGGYREKANYHLIATLGNPYLRRVFPKMDWIYWARRESPALPAPRAPRPSR